MADARSLQDVGEELRRIIAGRRRKRRRLALAALIGCMVVPLTASILWRSPVLFVWNTSASAPIGLYRVRPGEPARRGDTRLQAERERLRERMKQIYLDNMDDKIEDGIFRALTAQFRRQERKIARELELRLDADLSYMDEGIALMSISKDAKRRFLKADLAVKKHVLSVVLSNCSFRDRTISATYRKPFDIIAEKLPRSSAAARGNGAKIAQNAKWLPGPDSNRRPSD